MNRRSTMNMHASSSAGGPIRRALSGVLFPAFFLVGEAVAGRLATAPLPVPDAPVAEVVAYYGGSRSAAMALGAFQALSAVALLVFAACVVLFLRRTRADGGALAQVARGAGILAALFLLASALLALALTQAAVGGDPTLLGTLRSLNFLTGGTLHVASLGLFVGAASLAARRAGALPGWIVWLGIVQAVVSVLSLASLLVFYAALFILLGRMLGFVWCAAVGVALALGRRSAPAAAAAGR
jgi:hypothetical protein